MKREARADKKLYEKIKEAGINASFKNSSIRLADAARPPVKQVLPNIPMNAVLAFLLSALIAVASAVFFDLLDNTVRDPESVAKAFNVSVLGTLPVVVEKEAVGGDHERDHRYEPAPATDSKTWARPSSPNPCGPFAITSCWRISTGG